jgi:hypothetical protein
MRQLALTLAAALSLGRAVHADTGRPIAADYASGSIAVERSHRGVAQDYLVLPSGGELTAQMRFVTADAMLDGDRLKFTDLALFGVSGRWSLFTKLEVSASVELLPKQPSFTDEKPWQSVGFALRSPLGRHVALALSGGGGHLMDHTGMWTREALTLDWKKPIHRDFLAFDIQAGVQGLGLRDPKTTSSTAFLTEVSLRTTALFHEPRGHWGAWLGIAYAVPVQASGRDPTTELPIDPQPRLGFHVGTVLSAVKQWDIFVDVSVIDRGDLANPATRLPILDGGFDQRQIMFGVTRHIEHRRRSRGHDGSGGAIQLGQL